MSAAASVATAAAPAAAAAGDRPTGLARLTLIELRKMADTRAGLWLLLAVAVLTLVAAVARAATVDASGRSFADALEVAQFPVALLLPVVAILSVTSEWSQRTALTTFALVPDRLRVVAAKLGAMGALAVAAVVLCLVAAVLGTALGPVLAEGGASWDLRAAAVPESLAFHLANLSMAAAFGLLILRSAPAIVLFFVLPTVWAILLTTIPGLDGAVDWLDTSTTFAPLVEGGADAGAWARIGVSAVVWIVVPLVVGVVRIRRSEVR